MGPSSFYAHLPAAAVARPALPGLAAAMAAAQVGAALLPAPSPSPAHVAATLARAARPAPVALRGKHAAPAHPAWETINSMFNNLQCDVKLSVILILRLICSVEENKIYIINVSLLFSVKLWSKNNPLPRFTDCS